MDSMIILGSTGSIGTQSLECAKHLGIHIEGISANKNIGLLEEQIRLYNPEFCVVADKNEALRLAENVKDTKTKVFGGTEGIFEMLSLSKSKTVINSIIGFAGLLPTLYALDCEKKIALANKETLVAAGELVMGKSRQVQKKCAEKGDFEGGALIPIDSEHCAVHQCINATRQKSELKRIIITASGGPFFGYTKEMLEKVTPEDALKHPNWSMGKKITIDSATMVNKGLEIIEAGYLFDIPVERVDYVVQRESIVHSMVEFTDNSVLAQLSVPDMRLCIQYALTYPERKAGLTESFDFSKVFSLRFAPGDDKNFPAVLLAKKAASMGGIYPCVFNGANEACVDLFLNKKIKFTDIYTLIGQALENINSPKKVIETGDIIEADKKAREFVYDLAK